MKGSYPVSHAVISNVFGTLGAICWSVQLTPQIILNHRRHSAAGLSPAFMLFWAAAGVPLGAYNIAQNFNLALRIQPQILTSLSLITWGQCYHYERKWNAYKVGAVVVMAAVLLGGVEAALVFAVRIGIRDTAQWPLMLMAILAALFLALGVLEQYLAIWKNRSVQGISFLFCGIDALGDITSIVSVSFEPKLRILGLVIYTVELVLWIGVFACGAYFRLIPFLKGKGDLSKTRPDDRTAPEAVGHGVSLHSVPSSTSVFSTASQRSQTRPRRVAQAPAA